MAHDAGLRDGSIGATAKGAGHWRLRLISLGKLKHALQADSADQGAEGRVIAQFREGGVYVQIDRKSVV